MGECRPWISGCFVNNSHPATSWGGFREHLLLAFLAVLLFKDVFLSGWDESEAPQCFSKITALVFAASRVSFCIIGMPLKSSAYNFFHQLQTRLDHVGSYTSRGLRYY